MFCMRQPEGIICNSHICIRMFMFVVARCRDMGGEGGRSDDKHVADGVGNQSPKPHTMRGSRLEC